MDAPDAPAGDGDDLVGAGIERREDPTLLTGRAEYVDDLTAPGMGHLAILRSQYGHARIDGIETGDAEALDGVYGVFTAADVAASDAPGVIPVTTSLVDESVEGHPILARDRVRYQGEPVAVAVAEDRYLARDALAAVDVDYERLDAVTDPEAAIGAEATLHDAAPDNVAVDWTQGDREAVAAAFADADHVAEVELENNRLTPNEIEPRAALARSDGERLTVEMTSQTPHRHRELLARTLALPEQRIRVNAPHVGGGFGHKAHHHPGEALAAWCSLQLERPVKWVETRSGDSLAGAHARDHRTSAALALDSSGRFRALRADTTANLGAYALGRSPVMATTVYGRMLSGQYTIPEIHAHVRVAFTNTAPVHAYRGAGQPESIYVVERLVDAAAREFGFDPVSLRRRNQIESFPHESATGAVYDSGNYARALDVALDAANYDGLRERRAAAREEGRCFGIGVACYAESTGVGPFESGVVRVHPSGGVTVYAGTHSHGQGHGTTYAQVVADALGVPYEDVEVVEGDTERIPAGVGTFGSRSAMLGGSALERSAERVIGKARRIAADRLEVADADLEYERRTFSVAGAPDRSVDFDDVAAAAHDGDLPDGMEPGLEATTFYEPEESAYTSGTHVAAVEVDPESGAVSIERYVAVDDCGERLNPRIVEGQVHGGVVQGIGQALLEHARYDDAGNLLTGTFQDYAMPRAGNVPDLATGATVTPSPHNPLGAKGIGEAGTIAAPPTVVNAVLDAVAPLGVERIDMPLTPETVWRACRET